MNCLELVLYSAISHSNRIQDFELTNSELKFPKLIHCFCFLLCPSTGTYQRVRERVSLLNIWDKLAVCYVRYIELIEGIFGLLIVNKGREITGGDILLVG